jgi:hypothetical protein
MSMLFINSLFEEPQYSECGRVCSADFTTLSGCESALDFSSNATDFSDTDVSDVSSSASQPVKKVKFFPIVDKMDCPWYDRTPVIPDSRRRGRRSVDHPFAVTPFQSSNGQEKVSLSKKLMQRCFVASN